MRLGMVIDLDRCIGCDACTLACKAEQGTPGDVYYARVYKRVFGEYPNVRGFFLPVLCNQCENPACMNSCPAHAITITPEGVVVVDDDKCTGCKTCVAACPYGNMFLPDGYGKTYYNDYVTPIEEFHRKYRKPNTAMKCDFCLHRVRQGLDPACVAACPAEARIFGDLDDPNSKPNKYIKERVPPATLFQLLPEAGTKPKVMYIIGGGSR